MGSSRSNSMKANMQDSEERSESEGNENNL